MGVLTNTTLLLRAEGAAVLALAVVLYATGGWSWIVFVVALLAPDVSMVGYAAGPAAGAAAYNLIHLLVWPVVLGIAGALSGNGTLTAAGLIWAAHIGMDRLLGFGLKQSTRFGDTHLGPVGKARAGR